MVQFILLLMVGMFLHSGVVGAQTLQTIDGNVPMFCLDSAGVFQRLVRTTYGNMQEGFARQFQWGHSLRTPSNTQGILEFSAGGATPGRERIYYEVQPYNGGIALLRMHVRFQGKVENPVGTKMCGMTVLITNMAGPDTASVPAPAPGRKDADLSDYPATVYHGRPKMPDFSGRDRDFASYRTRIRDGLEAGPNFAGHYALIQFGCGTGCSATIIADAITGRVFNFPLSGEDYSQLDLKFAPTSNLVVGRWLSGERCMREALLWDGRGFKSLGKKDVGEGQACN